MLDWARNNWPGLIPPHAYEGKAFEHDQAGLRIAATSNADGTLWAFRSEHLGDQSRNWVTDAVIADLGAVDALIIEIIKTHGSVPNKIILMDEATSTRIETISPYIYMVGKQTPAITTWGIEQ